MSQTTGEGDQSRADAVSVRTANGSAVAVDITIRYRIDADNADSFVSEWNNERQMEQRLIRPTVRSTLRDEASSLQTTGPGSIYTQEGRQALENTTVDALEREFDSQAIILESVQIRNIDLPDSIDQTIDERESAEQEVEIAQQEVLEAEAAAEQQIVEAEADAEEDIIAAQADANATRIRGEALDEYPIVLTQQEIQALESSETVYVPVGDGSGLTLTREVEQGASNSTNESGE
jgi:regulator of protease activity HflC (stomatin/prohibitin superfamily)